MNPDEIQERLRVALRAAMKARDTVATSALRSVLAAIANAEAVPPVADRRAAAAQYEASGNGDRAARLRHEAEVIESAADLRLATGHP